MGWLTSTDVNNWNRNCLYHYIDNWLYVTCITFTMTLYFRTNVFTIKALMFINTRYGSQNKEHPLVHLSNGNVWVHITGKVR